MVIFIFRKLDINATVNLVFKDQVHCRIDVEITKIFYHHWIEHYDFPIESGNFRL